MFLISLVNVFSKKTEINVYFMSTISFIVKLIIQICLYKAADGGGEKTVVLSKKKMLGIICTSQLFIYFVYRTKSRRLHFPKKKKFKIEALITFFYQAR